jgi:hypothetical protein
MRRGDKRPRPDRFRALENFPAAFPGLGKKIAKSSKAWKNGENLFQSLEAAARGAYGFLSDIRGESGYNSPRLESRLRAGP